MKNFLLVIAFSILIISPVQAEETFKDASERLFEAFHFILHTSLEPINREELVNELIEVMLENLDENSRFLDPEQSENHLDELGEMDEKGYVTFFPLGDFLYIRISMFGSGTQEQFLEGFDNLDDIPKGIVLDLRGNPGGWLHEGVAIVDAFIDRGLIVEQHGRNNAVYDKVNATQAMLVPKSVPIVILIDEDSASAAEVVASALKDHNRAILFGETSYGKGTVQRWREFENGSSVWVTTKKYFTKGGREIHEHGIEPNIIYVKPYGFRNNPK